MGIINQDAPVLVGQAGPLNGRRWLVRGEMLIGRDSSNDIVIEERQVSRIHARFFLTPQGIWLEDMSSKNGTHHNGKLIEESVLLQDGDIIQIALAQKFIFVSSDATLPLSAEDAELMPVQIGRLKLEKQSRRIWIKEQEVIPPLSVAQFKLLEMLYEQQGLVVSRLDLMAGIWESNQDATISEQALDALIRRLRDRLASIDPTHQYVETVRGHGLRLDNPPSD
ncbi:MAG: FHA domain-containing protein [Anaerolineales bacterium]|nr:FHA domain-containing protein [Anaerolineales bacterium]